PRIRRRLGTAALQRTKPIVSGYSDPVMATSLLIEDRLEIPLGLRTLADFRAWALSDDFPEKGRIDYVQGRIEVDMSPEDLFSHGTPKSEIVMVVGGRAKQRRAGFVLS